MAEWYDDLGPISIGCQSYGPDEPYGKLKVGLWQKLCKEVPDVYIGPIRHLALALRVGGKFKDFPKIAITQTRVMAKKGYVGCDIEIPISAYDGIPESELRSYLSKFINDAVENLLNALRRKKFEGNYDAVSTSCESACRIWQDE